jgi:Family of unknown function (DUF6494)
MDEEALNTSVRKFLKKLGVTAQREIEKAVRESVATGRLKGSERLPTKAVITLGGIDRSRSIRSEPLHSRRRRFHCRWHCHLPFLLSSYPLVRPESPSFRPDPRVICAAERRRGQGWPKATAGGGAKRP